jgi:hypothetical protein
MVKKDFLIRDENSEFNGLEETMQNYNLFPSLGKTTQGLNCLASSKCIEA